MDRTGTRATGLALLYAPGDRPTSRAIDELVGNAGMHTAAASISHRAPDGDGWLELVAGGLTFDLRGLAPAAPVQVPAVSHAYGFGEDAPDPATCESVDLVASEHIAAGGAQPAVVRRMVGLAADLALQTGALGLAWRPAQTLMEPRYFARIVLAWLGGGGFPALGLTAIDPAADGSVLTAGLGWFIGSEMQLEGRAGESRAQTFKLAVRLVDLLVRTGGLDAPLEIPADGETLVAEPSRVGGRVMVWRERRE